MRRWFLVSLLFVLFGLAACGLSAIGSGAERSTDGGADALVGTTDGPPSDGGGDAGPDPLVRLDGGPVHLVTVSGGSAASFLVSAPATNAGTFHLAAIATKPHVAITSVTGLGLVWSLVRGQCGARDQTMAEVWSAAGVPLAAGPVTATFAVAPTNAIVTVSQYRNASSVGTIASANTLGAGGACSGGTDATTVSVTVPPVPPSSIIFAAIAIRTRTHTCGAGCVELGEARQGDPGDGAGLAIVESLLPTVSGTLDVVTDWAEVALELKP